MDEMMRYIFATLRSNEKNLKNLAVMVGDLRSQRRILTIAVGVMGYKLYQTRKEVKALGSKVEELQKTEGD